MINLKDIKNIFIDFDGVIVDSNAFKEISIEKSIFEVLSKNIKTTQAIKYFNENAGISREEKLSVFFDKREVSKVMELYSKKCNDFFLRASPTVGVKEFLEFLKKHNNNIKIYILSGGKKEEIRLFLHQNSLDSYFDEILDSDRSKTEHLKERNVSKNDIFIGDTKIDLKASTEIGLRFILIGGYKSLKSYPSEELIKESELLETKNFESLIHQILL